MLLKLLGIALHLVLIIGLALLFFAEPNMDPRTFMLTMPLLCLGSLAVVVLHIQRYSRQALLFNPIVFLSVCVYCYTFGYVLPYVAGLVRYNRTVFYSFETMGQTMTVAAISFLAFMCGLLCFYRPPRHLPSAGPSI